jgi:hypothetical protein
MLRANNAAVGLETRRHLRALLRDGVMDEPSLALLQAALAKTRPRSHAGWVFLLADALGAPRSIALRAGSVAEVFCCAVDLVDDVEDGDAAAYLPGCAPAVLVNAAAHAWVVAGLFASLFERGVPSTAPVGLTASLLGLASSMACGQRIELTREGWNEEAYARVSDLTGGRQLEAYFRIATFAARAEPSPFVRVAAPLGRLLQMRCDEATNDQRLLVLPATDVESLRNDARASLQEALRWIPARARPVMDMVVAAAGG